MHRDHYFSYTPVPESTHLDCYYPESLPSFWNTPRSRLFPHPRLKIRAPTKTDMNSPLLRHLTLKISINRGHRRKIGTAKLWRRESLHCARTLHEISTKRNLIRKSLQFPTLASRNRITTFSSDRTYIKSLLFRATYIKSLLFRSTDHDSVCGCCCGCC